MLRIYGKQSRVRDVPFHHNTKCHRQTDSERDDRQRQMTQCAKGATDSTVGQKVHS